MRALPSDLRRQLASAVLAARRSAEAAARASMAAHGVFADRRPEHLDPVRAALRNELRAKWRQIGRDDDLLVAECAYEQWHRLLFARFLAENDLLLYPELEAPVTLEDCAELAPELGEPDAWSVAARFAAEILPGIFRLDDPCVRLRFAPEGRHALERIVDGLPREVFLADDALGWVYQYWQKDSKDEVNRSERKIGGAELGPVTQLFTENYMVRFLLENSVGAWWAVRHPDSPLVREFEYLRFDGEGDPAAGRFDGWPHRAAEVTIMDPCCGSGHFLVEAFSMLWQMRAEEEGLSAVEAQDAVLRDNLFGLDIDPRCVQIATFALVVTTWRRQGEWRILATPNIACSGLAASADLEEWTARAAGDHRLEVALARLHRLFAKADSLGSLISPVQALSGSGSSQPSLDRSEWAEVSALVDLATHGDQDDPAAYVAGATLSGIWRAADLLSRTYTLISTNVPYASRVSLAPTILEHLEEHFPDTAGDLATVFLQRSLQWGTTTAIVAPQNWLYQPWYRRMRQRLLRTVRWQCLARLGAGAFRQVSGEIVTVALLLVDSTRPGETGRFAYVDLQGERGVDAKLSGLRRRELTWIDQHLMLSNPDARIAEPMDREAGLLADYAGSAQGICTGDYPRFGRCFWELSSVSGGWERQQSTVSRPVAFGGREWLLKWDDGHGELRAHIQERLGADREGSWIRGLEYTGAKGVTVSQSGDLKATLYTGELLDNNAAIVVPHDAALLPAVWAYCRSDEYRRNVRNIDSALKVTNKTLLKVPFDVDRWSKVAAEAGPLPVPWSDDPTQWLFEGRPEISAEPLQVGVGRLLGYRWPGQSESDALGRYADADGIVCLPAVAAEAPAPDRLQELLGAAFGAALSPTRIKHLLEQTGSRKKNVADWLRDDFFRQHCALFQNRPFVWHVWDGRKNGFSALVNYHKLDHGKLEKLTYTYLGQDWMERMRSEVADELPGAEARLAAAAELKRKLELILEGERPHDIYVRWKPLHEQAIGWNPDLDDGVRLNIRPFIEAGVLRVAPKIRWAKDRGLNADGSERLNDIHLTLTGKRTPGKHGGA